MGPERTLLRTTPPGPLAEKDLDAAIPHLTQWQGKLGSRRRLVALVNEYEKLGKQAERIYVYGSQRYDEDTRVGRSLQMRQEASRPIRTCSRRLRGIRPEILAVGKPNIHKYVGEQPKLEEYQLYFDDILRAAPHTLTAAEEKMIARMGHGEAGGTVHSVFTSAELPFPESRYRRARRYGSMRAAYSKYRASPTRPTATPCSTRSGCATATSSARWPRRSTRTCCRTSPTRTCASSRARSTRRCSISTSRAASTSSCSPTCTRTCRRCTAT